MRVTITGATGLIGSAVVKALRQAGEDVTVLSRRVVEAERLLAVPAVGWEATANTPPPQALAGRDGILHLAGASVDRRWSSQVKREIEQSRQLGTRNLVAGLAALEPAKRPAVLVSSSSWTYYGPRGREPVAETAPPGSDFLARNCVAWEAEAEQAKMLGMRVVIVRTGLVLAREEGFLPRVLPLYRAGLGGPHGSGDQYLPWIHIDDEVGILLAALKHPHWAGAVNASAPEPATSAEFARALGQILGRPARLRLPRWLLTLAMGEMSRLTVDGVRAMPARVSELGYRFTYPRLNEALAALLR